MVNDQDPNSDMESSDIHHTELHREEFGIGYDISKHSKLFMI